MPFMILKLPASVQLAYAKAGSVVEETVGSIRTLFGMVQKMIAEGRYSGSNVINIMLAVSTGAASLSEAFPCLSAFTAGQIAAHKMFEMIHRKPEIDSHQMSGVVLDDIKGDIKLKMFTSATQLGLII
ncbi:hypothetical protein HPP92_021298 [Vanilla planifolia]|uniref:Uncharacterized protein n=1 Tax=Vanilla planifolia TaxID=51239 RepID=A0A835Q7Q3_VANPL|nr:hypothetical protein HPP92_021298 [Vanilla planifolia]